MRAVRSILALLFSTLVLCSAHASDLKLEAKLIWGTNDDTKELKHKPVDPSLTQSLHMFKWKNYVEITNQVASIQQDAIKEMRMSDKCRIQVKNLGSSRVDVKLFGSGKWVSHGVNTLPCAIGGGDKNDSAWFVVLRSTDAKTAEKK
jgi:hypothetical protein